MKDPTNGLFRMPTREERIEARGGAPLNPIKVMALLSPLEAAFFFSGWFAWMCDAFDFFALSLGVTRLSVYYGKSKNDITTAITLTLLFRSFGAVIMGVISDRYGRRWPLVANLVLIAVFSLATAYAKTFGAFLAVRCLFGIAMGGVWGQATATALENMPAASRGLASGILQQGYAFAYLIGASINLTWVQQENTWKVLFYCGAVMSLCAAAVRAVLPESPLFVRQQERKRLEREAGNGPSGMEAVKSGFKGLFKQYWARAIYGIVLMTFFNFLSHSSQDLYPTIISAVKFAGQPNAALLASKATIIGNCGAITGGMISGYVSQYAGRRLTMIAFVFLAGILIPAWILPHSFSGLAAGAFFVQFGVQGAWGVVPIYLSEISPPAYRATFAGVCYQLGNMVSSASAQIEARGGESLKIPNPKITAAHPEKTIPDYATVSGILLGVVCVCLIATLLFGKEFKGADFEGDAEETRHVNAEDDEEKGNAAWNEKGNSTPSDHKSIEHVGDVRQTAALDHEEKK